MPDPFDKGQFHAVDDHDAFLVNGIAGIQNKIFSEKMLTDDLDIGKVIVLKFSDKWECLLNSGFGPKFFEKVDMKRDLLPFEEISFITSEPQHFPELVDIVIPVSHKDQAIAFVLLATSKKRVKGLAP